MCLHNLQPSPEKNINNAIPWYLKTSGLTLVVIIIAMPSYPPIRQKLYGNLCLIGEIKS